MSFVLLHLLLVASACIIQPLYAAGYADGRESDPSATTLHLERGQYPRGGTRAQAEYGAGLVTRYLSADVVVAGGGAAGTSAALAAARNGATTIIVQSRKVLGGNASSESKLHMVGANKQGGRGHALKCEARESGIVEEYTLNDCVSNPQRCAENFDLTVYDLFMNEPNIVQLILNTAVVSAQKDPHTNRITSISAIDQSTQIQYVINGSVFVDATGDGRLGAEAYVPFIIGREGTAVYNESLAVAQTDNETEGSSFAFTSADDGRPSTFHAPSWARVFTASDFKYRSISANSLDYGYWWIEISYPYDNIRDNNVIQHLLLSNVLGIWDYIKNSGQYPSALNRSLNWFEWLPCKRQGRRFVGMHVQTQNEIMPVPNLKNASEFFAPELYWDRVAYGGWNFDLHNPVGIYDTAHPPYSSYPIPYVYSTPLRSLIASNVSNLFLAGRLASFSQVVFGSQRVMKTCATHGQAVGTAAAFCVQHAMQPSELALPANADAVWSIQQQLLRDDAYIIGVYNDDYRDYARNSSRISTNSIYSDASLNISGDPWQIISGQTRTIEAEYGGAAPGQYLPGLNRWMSAIIPAWITMEWNTTQTETETETETESEMAVNRYGREIRVPVNIASIELIFDTGLQRMLTLSQKHSDQSNMMWGEAQPETAKDYYIRVRDQSTGKWQTILNITGNYQRRRVHNVTGALAGVGVKMFDALTVNVTATNGYTHARICEMRIYDQDSLASFPVKL